ncbi:PP2C family protein-serine/threonine phosphatase [Candidatus Methylacidiphilum infernorum]|nr:PP2C family protein-serine/threonine phosphatase [Candidatus Methylacidiphilum infernorum]
MTVVINVTLFFLFALALGLWVVLTAQANSLRLRLKKAEEQNQLFIEYLGNFSFNNTLLQNIQGLLRLLMGWIPARGAVFLQKPPSGEGLGEPVLQLGNIPKEKWMEKLHGEPAETKERDAVFMTLQKEGKEIGSLFVDFEKALEEEQLKKIKEVMTKQALFFIETDCVLSHFRQDFKEETLRLLGEFQKGWVPKLEDSLQGFRIAAKTVPCSRFSGDFYDSIRVGENSWAFVLSDVSAKGLASFFISAMCRTAIRSLVKQWQSPTDILCRLNELLYPEICGRTIISLIYMVVDEKQDRVTFARAGHELPIFCRNGKIEKIDFPGICLGVDEGRIFNKMVKEYELKIQKGDFLLLFTDGLIEAVNNEGIFFGRQRAENIVRELADKDPQYVVDAMIERLNSFCQDNVPFDDITLLAMVKK